MYHSISSRKRSIIFKLIIILFSFNFILSLFTLKNTATTIKPSNFSTENTDLSHLRLTNCSILSAFNGNFNAKPQEIKIARIGFQDILFVVCGRDGLMLFDITKKEAPTFMFQYESNFFVLEKNEYIYSILFENENCFIVFSEGVLIYDFSDISNPSRVAKIELGTMYFREIKIKQDLLFIVDYYEGCYVYNVSVLDNPIFIGLLSTNSYHYYDIAFYQENEDIKIILASSLHLTVYNYSSILNLEGKEVCSLEDLYINKIIIKDDLLLGYSSDSLVVFNINQNYKLISKHADNQYGFQCLEVKENYLFIGGRFRLVKADISNPKDITYITELDDARNLIDLLIAGNYLITLDSFSGIDFYSIESHSEISLLQEIYFSDDSNQVLVSGNYVFYSTDSSGIFIVNTRNPRNPKIENHIDCPYSYYTMIIEDTRLYVFTRDFYYPYVYNILVYDIKNPKNPRLIGNNNRYIVHNEKEYSIDFDEIEIIGYKMYSLYYVYSEFTTESGIALIDLTNPNNFTIIDTFSYDSGIRDLFVKDSYLYSVYGNPNRIKIHALTNTGALMNSSISLEFDWSIRDLQIEDDYMYISFSSRGLVIYDIKNPDSPIELSNYRSGLTLDNNYYREIVLSNNYLYLLRGYEEQLYILNVNNKSEPVLEGKILGFEDVNDLCIANNHIFLTTEEVPLLIAHLDKIPFGLSIPNQIFISIGAFGFVVLGGLVFVLIRKYRPHYKIKEDLIETTTEIDITVNRENTEPIMKTQVFEIPKTDDPELKKYFEQIFSEKE